MIRAILKKRALQILGSFTYQYFWLCPKLQQNPNYHIHQNIFYTPKNNNILTGQVSSALFNEVSLLVVATNDFSVLHDIHVIIIVCS